MQISAALLLEIDQLRASAREAEARLKAIGATGAAVTSGLNRNFAGVRPRVPVGGDGRSQRAAAAATERLRRNTITLASAGGSAVGVMNELGMMLRLVTFAATAAGAAMGGVFAVDSVKAAGAFQDTELQVARFAGSVKLAKSILRDVTGLSVRTPFQTGTMQDLTAGLLSAGIAAEGVFGTVERLAKVAGNDQQLSELGDVLGKGFANKKFDLEKIKQFLDRSVNVLPALAQVKGTDSDGLSEMIRNGEIGFKDMEAALDRLSAKGGQFFGLMEARSQTLPGLWSTLVSNLKLFQVEMGKPMVGPLSDALREIIDQHMPGMIRGAADFGSTLAGAAEIGLATFQEMDNIPWVDLWGDFAATGMATIGILAQALGEAFGTAMQRAVDNLPGLTYFADLGAKAAAPGRISKDESSIRYWESVMPFARRADDAANPDYKRFMAEGRAAGMGEWERRGQWLNGPDRIAGPKELALLEKIGEARERIDRAEQQRDKEIGPGAAAPPKDWWKDVLKEAFQTVSSGGGRFGSGEGLDAVRQRFAVKFDEILDRIQERAEANVSTRVDPLLQDVPKAVPAPDLEDDGTGGGAGSAVRRVAVPGTLQQAVNRIAGRSAYELMATEAVRQTGLMERTARTLDRIEKKMTETVTVEQTGPVGVFAE